MDRTARCRWVAGYRFDSESHTGKTIRLDGWKDREDPEAGPTPAELVPISLGACTGMDVVHIMGKMKVEFEALEVEVNSTLRARPMFEAARGTEIKSTNATKKEAKRSSRIACGSADFQVRIVP